MDDQLLRVFSRINASPDGVDFVAFLRQLSANNYKAFKCAPTDYNDIHKGQAIAIDGLIEMFESADSKLQKEDKKDEAKEWL